MTGRTVVIPSGGSELEELLAWQMRAAKLPTPDRQFRFAKPRRWRSDFAWVDRMLLAEVDGATWTSGRHTRGSGVENDCEKVSTAAALGYRCLRFTRSMVEDGRALALVEQALAYKAATSLQEDL